ncbi:MAG TPA: hypothetical protein VGM17_06600 [Rhizomicrobium sp.]|jgi:hypothetical protein
MTQEIHFEIFSRQGAKGGWSLHDVPTNRESALEIAESLMREGRATGVKVHKETYSPETGDYLSLKIFEAGHNTVKTKPAAEDLPHALPCFKPDDLYSYHSRATIARLLCDYLTRSKLTVTELIHRADALEKFEATGTLFQFAIQKVAVAQAANTGTPVQQIIKNLNELVTKAIHRVYRDTRRCAFPRVAAGSFAGEAEKLATIPDGAYLLNGAIARYLAPLKSWEEKVLQLVSLLNEATNDTPGAALLAQCLDSIVAEILHGSAALHELIGEHESLGAALLSLVNLFLGQPPLQENGHAGLLALTTLFAKDRLPTARTAVANRILAEIKSFRRLCPGSLIEEFAMVRKIANKLVLGQGKYLGHDDIVAAFALRSRRLVSHERIHEYMNEAPSPDEKLARLLLVEENIVGVENKRRLVSFIVPVVTSAVFENHFILGKAPLLARLQKIAQLQASVLKSGFQDNQKRELAEMLDRIASDAESRAKLFDSIEAKPVGHVEKATAILRLCAGGLLTEGRLSARARDLVLSHLGQPGFLTGYAAYSAQANATVPDPQAAISELMQMLQKAGIRPETGLRSIAA